MNYTLLENLLHEHGLRLGVFAALHPDADPYSVAVLQPSGDITASQHGIGNADGELAYQKHLAFFRLALEAQADLVMTPEYSTPWRVVEELVASGSLPPKGKLWVLGCESIKPEELQALVTKDSSINWIIGSSIRSGKQSFFDPVCYVFRAERDGKLEPVVAVQFKAQPMSDPLNNLERDYMIRGNEAFILRNDQNSVNLVTLICSDALGFKESTLPQNLHVPYLVLHPQLNRDPRYNAFRAYRNDAYLNNRDKQEFLCVNWARGFRLPGYGPSHFGGSAYYLKSDALTLNDERMGTNHDKGLYYTICLDNRSNTYFFNYCEHVFVFQTTKPSQAQAMGVLQRRTGPEMIRTLSWDSASGSWTQNAKPDDGFVEVCTSVGENVEPLSDPDMTCLNKERLLALSNAAIKSSQKHKWFEPAQLLPFVIKEDEVVRRMTFVQDPNGDAYNYRYNALVNFSKLRNEILVNSAVFPKSIIRFYGDCRIKYPVEPGFNHNLVKLSDGSKATIAYVGRQPEAAVDRAYRELSDALEVGDRLSLVVWFEKPTGEIGTKWSGDRPLITANFSEGARSIAREEP